jgi:hypothetical protein
MLLLASACTSAQNINYLCCYEDVQLRCCCMARHMAAIRGPMVGWSSHFCITPMGLGDSLISLMAL